jgi:hypothetical protein
MLVSVCALLVSVHVWLWQLQQLQVQFVSSVTEQSKLAAVGNSDGRAVGVLHE